MLSTAGVDISAFNRDQPQRVVGTCQPFGHNACQPGPHSRGHGPPRTPAAGPITYPTKTLFSIIQAAGWPIWPLLLCSVAALTLIIERLFQLRQSLVAPPRLTEEVIGVLRQQLPSSDVIDKLEGNSVLGAVLAGGIRAAATDPRIGEDGLRQAFENAGRRAVHGLERYLNALGTIAAAAPLLGLLGTVIGMIEIFGSQAPGAGANPQALAHGISVALYNTAFGLIIAIPSLMCYRYFRGRVDEFQLTMELSAAQLLPQLVRLQTRSGAAAGQA
jgi:biopolymer transport protein ExbB